MGRDGLTSRALGCDSLEGMPRAGFGSQDDPAGLMDTCYVLIYASDMCISGALGPASPEPGRILNKSIVYCRFSSQVAVVCVCPGEAADTQIVLHTGALLPCSAV